VNVVIEEDQIEIVSKRSSSDAVTSLTAVNAAALIRLYDYKRDFFTLI